MVFRFRLRTMLAVIAVMAIVLAGSKMLYDIYDIRSRRSHTIDGLNSVSGIPSRVQLAAVLEESTDSSMKRPKLVLAEVKTNYYLTGYVLDCTWVSHVPMADGVQIRFSDGTTENVAFGDEWLSENESRSNRSVLFHAAVDDGDCHALSDQSNPSDIVSVALISGNETCSNALPVDSSGARPEWHSK